MFQKGQIEVFFSAAEQYEVWWPISLLKRGLCLRPSNFQSLVVQKPEIMDDWYHQRDAAAATCCCCLCSPRFSLNAFMPSKIAVMLVKMDFGSVDASTAEWIFLLE